MIEIAICDDSEYARQDIIRHLFEYSLEKELDYRPDEIPMSQNKIPNAQTIIMRIKFA